MLEVDSRGLVAGCRRELLERLKDSFGRISKNRMRAVLVDVFNNLPDNLNEWLAQKYKDEIIWRNELMIKILTNGF